MSENIGSNSKNRLTAQGQFMGETDRLGACIEAERSYTVPSSQLIITHSDIQSGRISPKAILIDWDNTIIEHRNDAMHIFIKECGISMNDVHPLIARGLTFIEMLTELLHSRAKAIQANKRYHEIHNKIYVDRIPTIIDGAIDFLKILKNDDKILCVVSNRDALTLRNEIRELNLHEYFDAIVGAGHSAAPKPSPDPAFIALCGLLEPNESTQMFQEDVWFIGDSLADIECASSSGCLPILFGYNNAELAKCSKIRHTIVKDYPDLIKLYLSVR